MFRGAGRKQYPCPQNSFLLFIPQSSLPLVTFFNEGRNRDPSPAFSNPLSWFTFEERRSSNSSAVFPAKCVYSWQGQSCMYPRLYHLRKWVVSLCLPPGMGALFLPLRKGTLAGRCCSVAQGTAELFEQSKLDLLACFKHSPFEERQNPYLKWGLNQSDGPSWCDFCNSGGEGDFGVTQAQSGNLTSLSSSSTK